MKIAHEVIKGTDGEYETEYILTASTDELQKFILKYANPEDSGQSEINDDNFMRAQLTRTD